MYKTTQNNQIMFLALALLSFSVNLCDAVWAINSTNYCNGSVQSAEFTQYNSVAAATACGAACAASVIAINAAIAANNTACNAAVTQLNAAGDAVTGSCEDGATNACAIMSQYVDSSTSDSNTQTFAACNASMVGTTGCNAAYSASYIACNVAHAADNSFCNDALTSYVATCASPGSLPAACDDAYANVIQSCQSSGQTARHSCISYLVLASLSC